MNMRQVFLEFLQKYNFSQFCCSNLLKVEVYAFCNNKIRRLNKINLINLLD